MTQGYSVEIVKRVGGWYVTGIEWSGPWISEKAANYAKDGEYDRAHAEKNVRDR